MGIPKPDITLTRFQKLAQSQNLLSKGERLLPVVEHSMSRL